MSKVRMNEKTITVVVVDNQETDSGHKHHTDLDVGDPVVQEVASEKLEVLDIDIHLVEVGEDRFEVHILVEYAQDRNAVIQGDVEDRPVADLVDLREEVARMSELWQEETEVVGVHKNLAAVAEDLLMEVLEGLAGPVEAEILFELLPWTAVVVVATAAVVVVVGVDNPHLPV